MNCPKCGEVCRCLTEPPPNSLPIQSLAEIGEPYKSVVIITTFDFHKDNGPPTEVSEAERCRWK